MEHTTHKHHPPAAAHDGHYKHLLIMTVLSFIAMYILMYAMVDTFSNVFNNVNQFYMAGLMATPMVIIEIIVMSAMYKKKKLNAILLGSSAVLMILFYLGIRQQTAVGDKQFLRSMIPHYASALLMAGKASVTDPELKELCKSIIASQQKEIDQMKAKLQQLDK